MRLFIDYDIGDSGKGKFLKRLVPCLEKLNVKIVNNGISCDIALGISRWRTKTKAKKVLRIDGIHLLKNKRNLWLNDEIRRSMRESDSVVFQSRFAKEMCSTMFKMVHGNAFIVNNGADPELYKCTPAMSSFINNVVMSAKWTSREPRPHKRLKEMLDIAVKYADQNPDTAFHVMGKIDGVSVPEHPNIRYWGHLADNDMRHVLAMADVMLNLAWYDWCPNSVVEALVAGVPVICTAGHGVEELVNGYGTALQLDNPPDARMYSDLIPPPIKTQPVLDALKEALSFKRRVAPESLYINNIALKYYDVFCKTLEDG